MTVSPVHVDAALDPQLKRWLWLVKWFLAIPHIVVLVLLWAAFAVLSVVAFFAILFTGRYPRPIFDFNVGVLRWTWRVTFYAYGALGTDRYPPFSLDEVDDYPAHLRVDYPDHLSRGLVLVKWWLLAIPHYLVVGLFLGGGLWLAGETGADDRPWVWGSGLVGLLVLIAAVVLLFTGRYPQPIFDLVLGMQRWVLRVAAYAALMTDTYPPFRLDMGGSEPTPAHLSVPTPAPPAPAATASAPGAPAAHPSGTTGWGAGRIAAVVSGSVALLLALGLFGAAGTVWFVDRVVRDDGGFVTSPAQTFRTSTHAIASSTIAVDAVGGIDTTLPERILGDARVRVTATDGSAVFIGIASSADVRAYLDDVSYTTVARVGDDGQPVYRNRPGDRPATAPTGESIWAESAAGTGTQSVTWVPDAGDWTVVVMNADGAPGVAVTADAGAELPVLDTLSTVLFVPAVVLFVGGVVLAAVAVVRRKGER